MKQFRPFRFPPLQQYVHTHGHNGQRVSGQGQMADAAQWQASVSEGFEQGQRDGYEIGLQRGQEDGFEAGRQQGVELGREEGRQETLVGFDHLARPVDGMLKSLKKLRTDYRAAQRKEVVDLVAKVARNVIRAELALQPVQIMALVDETLASMPPTRDEIDVYLNPEEVKRIMEVDPKRAKRWNLIGDPRLDLGECHIRAGDTEVDAGCHQRLAAVMEQVDNQLQAADGGDDAESEE